jgi:hypothetical protein
MILLQLAFLAPAVLAVSLTPELPQLALRLETPAPLPLQLVADTPQLNLVVRPPQQLDVGLLPVLLPLPGEAAVAPVSRTLTWSSGRLTGVSYADGRSKALTWTGGQLTRVDHLRPTLPTLRADLSYNPDGTLAGVTQSEA